jgi:hypothetical protein
MQIATLIIGLLPTLLQFQTVTKEKTDGCHFPLVMKSGVHIKKKNEEKKTIKLEDTKWGAHILKCDQHCSL